MEKKILITGSKGRIGLDVKKYFENFYKIIELNRGDDLSLSMFKHINLLIHLAARTPKKERKDKLEDYITDNVEYTKKILSFASRGKVEKVILPTSWSWKFKIGSYQYSKLLQEKIAEEYKKIGMNILILELPEVINSDYNGIIRRIMGRLEKGVKTYVDSVNISTITTREFCGVCREFMENGESSAFEFYKKSIRNFNLYDYIKEEVKKKFPNKLSLLKKGKEKTLMPIIENKIIIFPDFEYD
ncbi:MAG: NAD(P)-dependent oxidoreductase [Candidatus Pacearchaeota archaeon]